MALNRNSNTYVTGFVIVITVICALIIATAAVVLKPAQQQQVLANVQMNVLKVSGIEYTPSTLDETYSKHIVTKYVDRKTGDFMQLPEGVRYEDILTSSKYEQYRTTLTSEQNLPGLKDNLISDIQQVFLVKGDNGEVEKVVLPFYGNGLWSVMYGFLAVSVDGNTVKGITYYSQGETPGLGGEVENPLFTAQFVDKQIYAENDPQPKLLLAKGVPADDKHRINALTGATLTSNGVTNQLQFWLGEQGFAKFLEKLQKGEVNYNE